MTARNASAPSCSRRRSGALLAAIVLAAGVLGVPVGDTGARAAVTRAGTATPLSATATVTFYGRGYGHGVGMSQYGARGRALEGQLAPDILAHYYTGTTIGAMASGLEIRVMVLQGFKPTTTRPFRIIGRGGTWEIVGKVAELPADATLEMALLPARPGAKTRTWQTIARAADGRELYRTTELKDLLVAPSTPETRLQVWSKRSGFDRYRGTLRVTAGSSISVVDQLGVNDYLRGVVPVEMPASWPTEALRAQAIAARTFAVRRIRAPVGTFDVYDDARSQVYRGALGEVEATTQAIVDTGDMILTIDGAVADGFFHSTGGGWTEDNEKAWVGSTGKRVAAPVSYLRGVSDRRADGTSYDAASPYATWQTAPYSLRTLSSIFARDPRTNVGTLTALDLSTRGVSKRLIAVRLIGSRGARTVSGEVFRSVFNTWRPKADPQIRSTLVDLAPIP